MTEKRFNEDDAISLIREAEGLKTRVSKLLAMKHELFQSRWTGGDSHTSPGDAELAARGILQSVWDDLDKLQAVMLETQINLAGKGDYPRCPDRKPGAFEAYLLRPSAEDSETVENTTGVVLHEDNRAFVDEDGSRWVKAWYRTSGGAG